VDLLVPGEEVKLVTEADLVGVVTRRLLFLGFIAQVVIRALIMAVMEDNTAGMIEAEAIEAGAVGGPTGLQMMGMVEVVKLIETRHPIRGGSVGVKV